MMRISIAVAAACALSLALPASAQLIGSGDVMGNGTGALSAPTGTPLVQIMNQPGSGIASGVGTALGNAPNTQGGLATVPSGGLTANLPVIGGGAGSPLATGTASGNTTVFGTTSGTLTFGHCVSIDSSHNLIDAGGACTTGGAGGTVGSGSVGNLAVYTGGTTVNGTTTGTGVVTAAGFNVGSAGSIVVNGGALGTPSSGSAANLTSIPMANASGTLAIGNGGLGVTTLTANLPLIGNGSSAVAQGTRSGSTTAFLTADGALTSGHCGQIDGSGGIVDSGAACGGSGGGIGITNASGSAQSTTGTISASSTALTLAAAKDFANGQGIRVNHAGAAFTLNAPTAASVTPQGAAGSHTWQYKIASVDAAGGYGVAIAAFQTTTGNATLSVNNYNALSWTAASGTAPSGYAVFKNISGTYKLIGIAIGTTFDDFGYTGNTWFDWLPSSAPASAGADALITTIASGAGTTSLTLAGSSVTAATSQAVFHDDSAAVSAYISANPGTIFPAGTFYLTSGSTLANDSFVVGQGSATTLIDPFPNGNFFTIQTDDRVSSFRFRLAPGGTGIFGSSAIIGQYNLYADAIDNIVCQGASNGGGGSSVPNCVYMVGIVYLTVDHVMSNSDWLGGTGFGINGGGDPPNMIFTFATGSNDNLGIFVSNTTIVNDDDQVQESGAYIAFNDCYNCSLAQSYINGSNSANDIWYGNIGVEFEGPSQALAISGTQILGFSAGISMDSTVAGSPITLNVTNSLFDFCGFQCIAINAGGWVQIHDSVFVGEGNSPWLFTGNHGIAWNTGVTGGPNVIAGNTFNGFSGTGGVAISFGSAMNNTTEGGNQFTSNSTNVSGGTGGSNSALGQNCSGAPSGSFSVFNGVIGHC